MNIDISIQKIVYTICIGIFGAVSSFLVQPLIHENQEAINIIVTVFSILAGFLIAVITLVGDPQSLPPGSWRLARHGSDLTYRRLLRHKWLFIAYLITLFLIFLSILIKDKPDNYQVLLEYIYMFFASVSCLLSFTLPGALIDLQRERIENEIIERRKNEGIED